jgi:hypothetical protein
VLSFINLRIDFKNQSSASIKAVDRTIPNLIDNSFLDAVDLAEADRLFGFKSLNVPGKSRRASSSLNNFSSEETSRMCILRLIFSRGLTIRYDKVSKKI